MFGRKFVEYDEETKVIIKQLKHRMMLTGLIGGVIFFFIIPFIFIMLNICGKDG